MNGSIEQGNTRGGSLVFIVVFSNSPYA